MQTNSYKVGVKTPGDKDWVYSGLRFATEVIAKRYGQDLFMRWTAVDEWVVTPSEDLINCDENGKLLPQEVTA